MRATVEYVGVDDDLPPVLVKVVQGQEDLSIKVCNKENSSTINCLDK
jgi:hypothetical protein